MLKRSAAALIIAACVSFPAKATYVLWDIFVEGTGRHFNYNTPDPIVAQPTVFDGFYTIAFDSANPAAYNIFEDPSTGAVNIISPYLPSYAYYRTFALTFTPGSLSGGATSNLTGANLISSSFGYTNGAHRQPDFVDAARVTSFSTRFSDDLPAQGLGLHILFEANALANVPEPATWAMMVLGFGAVGWAIRRTSIRLATV